MRLVRALLFGTLVGEAILTFTPIRNFWIVSAGLIVGLLATMRIHSSEAEQMRYGFSRRTFAACAITLNALTIVRMTQSSDVFPRLTLLTLDAEDNAEWLGIASTAMFSDENGTSFGLLYHAMLSSLNGVQVLLAPLFGVERDSISIPVNSVNGAYVLLLLVFPWISLSLPLQRKAVGQKRGAELAILLTINLFVLGALGEAYRFGHLSAAMTIFFSSLAIISLFSRGSNSPTTSVTSVLLLGASLTLWHPLRPLAVLILLVLGACYGAFARRRNMERHLSSLVEERKTLAAKGIVSLAILVVGQSTVITGIMGVVAPIIRALPYVRTFSIWEERRANYLDELIGAPGGTNSTSELFLLMLFAAATGICLYVLVCVARLDFRAILGLTLLGYLSFVQIMDGLDDGIPSYGPTKMAWMFVPVMMCITLCWVFAHEFGEKVERIFAFLSLSFVMIAVTVYSVADTQNLNEFLTAPDTRISQRYRDDTIVDTSTSKRWELAPDIESLPADGRTLGCVQLEESGLVAEAFDAYSCGRRIYRVTLTALTPSRGLSTALMWRSLGRLSHSEMMAMMSRYARPVDLNKRIIILDSQAEFLTIINLQEFLQITSH